MAIDRQIATTTRSVDLDFEIPRGRPVPLGYVSQQFSVYRAEPSEAFQHWMEKIPDAYREGVVEPLAEVGITPPDGVAEIGSLPNYHSLMPIAQAANKGVFELGGSEARGAQYTRARDTFDDFADIGREIVRRIDSVSARQL